MHFRSKEGGNDDDGAALLAPRHCSTRGRVALPLIFVITAPPAAFKPVGFTLYSLHVIFFVGFMLYSKVG